MVLIGPERTSARTTPRSRRLVLVQAVGRNMPGLLLAVLAVAVAAGVHALWPGVPMLTAAVVLGVVAAHLPRVGGFVRSTGRAGLSTAGKRLMRAGIVLLGLKLSLGDVVALGWESLVMVVGVVAATFFGTRWLGRRIGLSDDQSLLVATGYAICGASAIGAVSSVLGKSEHDERHEAEVASSVALVTLCGTLAIVVLPLLKGPLGMDAVEFGRWVGAGVHDVGQVVATAQTAGPDALTEGVLVKLIRVAMLAPLVAGVAFTLHHRRAQGAGGEAEAQAGAEAQGRRPALVPLFVAGFLVMAALRSTGLVTPGLLEAADTAQELLLAAALFGLGSAVYFPTLTRSGAKLATLGLGAWVLVGSAAYAGVLLTS